MELKPLKVSEVNQYIKRLLVSDPILYNISVEGEISNFKHHYNGHMYFTLKDDNSRLRCVMFNSENESLNFVPKDGMQVKIKGYISVYERDGSYQLYAKKIEGKGIGDLYAAFEELKKKLQKEGIFDDIHKQKIPYIPKKIGVVTSSTGAAVRDILTVINRRFPSVDILVYPVLVQGNKAPNEICRALEYLNSRPDIDLIITGRGGGSIEELWAFNEENVARAIFASRIPIISAVGHETDFTIADFVADLRAPTPSAAGELATPIFHELKSKLDDNLIRLEVTYKNLLNNKRNKLEIYKNTVMTQSPIYKFRENKEKLRMLLKDLIRGVNLNHSEAKNKLENIAGKLNTLSPLSTLNRGYSITLDENNKIINSTNNVNNNDTIKILLKDGELTSVVKEINKQDK